MIGKVKLTQEQADALKDYLADCKGDISEAIDEHSDVYCDPENGWIGDHKALNKIAPSDLARALLIGYEVEPEYKVGDWVAFIKLLGNHIISKVESVTPEQVMTDCVSSNGYKQQFDKETIRHATLEEIKAEQERRVWESIGREVGEFRDGDRADHKNGEIIVSVDWMKICYDAGCLKGIYPAESFIEFGGAEE